jgi:hypothetical protein
LPQWASVTHSFFDSPVPITDRPPVSTAPVALAPLIPLFFCTGRSVHALPRPLLWSTGDLEYGVHVIKITLPADGGEVKPINTDALDVWGTTMETTESWRRSINDRARGVKEGLRVCRKEPARSQRPRGRSLSSTPECRSRQRRPHRVWAKFPRWGSRRSCTRSSRCGCPTRDCRTPTLSRLSGCHRRSSPP